MNDFSQNTRSSSVVTDQFRDAGQEITRITREEILPAAELIDTAFTSAARSIERELKRAARSGSFSVKGLAQSLARDLGRVAVDRLVRNPIQSLLTNLFSAPLSGARANGGVVSRNAGFVVGERGPELFVPSTAGRVVPGAPGNTMQVTINVNGVSDVNAFRRSEGQIAAAMTRALARGQRNL